MRVGLILAAAAAILAAPAIAAGDDESKGDKLICKKQQPETGSRLGAKRVCATAAEWAAREQMQAEVKNNIDKIQQQRALVGN